jgi:hypothetical protein
MKNIYKQFPFLRWAKMIVVFCLIGFLTLSGNIGKLVHKVFKNIALPSYFEENHVLAAVLDICASNSCSVNVDSCGNYVDSCSQDTCTTVVDACTAVQDTCTTTTNTCAYCAVSDGNTCYVVADSCSTTVNSCAMVVDACTTTTNSCSVDTCQTYVNTCATPVDSCTSDSCITNTPEIDTIIVT